MIKKLKKIDYRHYICFIITVGLVLLSVFRFRYGIYRIAESFVDLYTSLKCYISGIFELGLHGKCTVIEFSNTPLKMPLNLPNTWDEFKLLWNEYWKVFKDKENFNAYIYKLGDVVYYLSKFLLIAIPFVVLLVVIFIAGKDKQNNNYNVDSKFLQVFKSIENKFFKPIIFWFKDFISFVKENRFWFSLWLISFIYDFNIMPIFIEFIAYYMYFVVVFDLKSLYVQFLKLLIDFGVCIDFIPLPIWLIIDYIIFDLSRKRIGYAVLNHMEMKNRGFINSLPVVVMGCASMGGDKTTIITDMGLSQEIMFRDKAYEKILENDLKFPNFPWINLENVLKIAIDSHIIYNLATVKQFISFLENYYYVEDIAVKKSIRRHLGKLHISIGSNCIFDYDVDKYGFAYNDNLKVVTVWEVIKDYSLLYFFYVVESSLLIANYSIRSDNVLESVGNFPLWDTELFRRDTRLQEANSRHSHILDFDMLRLGKKVIQDNPYSDLFEFGIILCTEIGKERGNMLDNVNLKKDSDEANPKNDLFDKELKMIRHGATIDNTSFVRVFCDEQRPENLGADARQVTNILHLQEKSDLMLAMPFFNFFELLYTFVISKFENYYSNYRFNRGDNTLFMYIVKNIVSWLNRYYKRIYNRFGYMKKSLTVEDGTQDGILKERDYYLLVQKIYSKRFSTDCHSGFFHKKALLSSLGLDDLPSFAGVSATAEELDAEHSYFIKDLNSGLPEFEKIKK